MKLLCSSKYMNRPICNCKSYYSYDNKYSVFLVLYCRDKEVKILLINSGGEKKVQNECWLKFLKTY